MVKIGEMMWNVETLGVQGSATSWATDHTKWAKISLDWCLIILRISHAKICKVPKSVLILLITSSLHRHYISSHVIWSDYHIVIVFHSAFITGTTGTTGTTALRVLDGLADLLLGLGHHGLEASPHGVLGVGVFAHRCVPRSMARPRSKTQNMSLPQRSNRFLQIPTDPTGFDQIWIWDTWEMRNNWFCHEFQHEFVRFFAEQPGLICTRLGPFTAALPLLCTDQEHAAATAKPTWAVKVDRSPRWELGRAASPAGTGATGAALLTVLTVPTGEAIRAGTSIFVNLLPPFVVQWLRNMQTQNTCHHDLRHVMNCHELS